MPKKKIVISEVVKLAANLQKKAEQKQLPKAKVKLRKIDDKLAKLRFLCEGENDAS